MTIGRAAAVATLFAVAGFGYAADPVTLKVRSVWEGLSPGTHRTPYFVEIQNNTNQDAVGQLRITCETDTVIVPVELARKSKKEVPAFVLAGDSPTRIDFNSGLGSYRARFSPSQEYANFRIGSIGDSSGLLTFLKIRRNNRGEVISDPQLSLGHCAPEDAPERAAGYLPLDAVFLADGTERLNPRQIEALKQYVVQGGRVLLSGGANVPALSMPAWQSVLPVRDASPKNFPAGTVLVTNGGVKYRITQPVTMMVGKPAPGAGAALRTEGQPVTIARPVGLGTLVILGFDPFVEPMDAHPNRRQMMMDALRSALYGASRNRVHQATLQSGMNDYEVPYPSYEVEGDSSGTAEHLYPHPDSFTAGGHVGANPFDIKLIPARTIGIIFAGFFFVVLPINFVVLKIIKKMEWAWVTTPIFSLVFSGILLSFAQGLYQAELSRSYQGFVVQDLDAGLNAQWIKSELFIPRGGTYNFSISKSDQVVDGRQFREPYRYAYYDEASAQSLTTLDNGTMELPQVDVSNLAFREFVYHRTDTEPLDIKIEVKEKAGKLEGRVHNGTELTLRRAAIVYRGTAYPLSDIPPNADGILDLRKPKLKLSGSVVSSGRFAGQAVLYALTSDFDPGGNGVLAKANSKVLIICTKSVEVEP